VVEYWTPAMARALRETGHDLLQTEFTQLASYGGDVLVEHDITMDLAEQEHRRVGSWRSRWNLWRWQRYEQAAIGRYRAIVTMSEKDKAQISHPRVVVVANGVDLERFRPLEEVDGERMLFIGSFRHYPNALAYRFLAEEFWPRYRDRHKGAVLEVVAGPKPEFYYPFGRVPRAEGIELHGFVGDVAPCYARANLVLIPTPVSAGTNIKALEAMAAGRAILATPSGVNGLGLRAGEEVAIAEGAEAFVAAAEKLLADGGKRRAMAAAARRVAEERYGWAALARRQEALWQELLEGR
jgi:glycosyltransferase involved in cell wall biosynthesis